MTQTHSQVGFDAHAMGTHPFDSVFVLCGLPPRSSDLAPLALPPGMLPLTADGTSNLDRLIDSVGFAPGADHGNGPDREEPEPPLRVLVENTFDPAAAGRPDLADLFVTDRDRYRGTGGVLRDAAEALDDDARILVLTASEVDEDDLAAAIDTVGSIDADVVLCRRADYSPAGLWSVRARCLRGISGVGYADFKEQVLADLAKTAEIRVATLARSDGHRHAIRDLNSYLACVADLRADGASDVIAEPDVQRSPEAIVVGSVLLRGAVVEPGAVVARSVIGPGVRVRSGQTVVDAVRTNADPARTTTKTRSRARGGGANR